MCGTRHRVKERETTRARGRDGERGKVIRIAKGKLKLPTRANKVIGGWDDQTPCCGVH